MQFPVDDDLVLPQVPGALDQVRRHAPRTHHPVGGSICPAFGPAYDAQVSGFAFGVFDHVTIKSILSILYSMMSILYYSVINSLFLRKAILPFNLRAYPFANQ